MLTAEPRRSLPGIARRQRPISLTQMPFVTFEGVEGCGKSTQLRLAAARLRELGHAVLETREPGGTPVGERLRSILLDPERMDIDGVTEWLLIEADRRQHVREVLKPALADAKFVLCDRYSDSTEAYQRAGRGLDAETVRRVDALARDGLVPDLTLLYDLDPEAGLARTRVRDPRVGRFEGAALSFHRAVRDAYLEIARREPQRVALIRADADADAVFAETWRRLAARFPS